MVSRFCRSNLFKIMIRHCKLNISYLDKLKDATGPGEYKTIDGVKVKVTSQRYKVFQDNRVCVNCGLEGSFLAIEKFSEDIKKYHINMYGVNKHGHEVLMTKDHIIPKSKGGKNIQSNYQTMCTKCNIGKGNGESMTLRKLFDDYVYNKTRQDIIKIDKLCIELDIEPNDFWYFYLKNKNDFSGVDFISSILTYFYYFLDNRVNKVFENQGIKMHCFFFYTEENNVFLGNSSEGLVEFKEKIVDADFDVKKKLVENKIFSHLLKKSKTNIFTKKQIRVLKLENLS